jgi:hypothetical protein
MGRLEDDFRAAGIDMLPLPGMQDTIKPLDPRVLSQESYADPASYNATANEVDVPQLNAPMQVPSWQQPPEEAAPPTGGMPPLLAQQVMGASAPKPAPAPSIDPAVRDYVLKKSAASAGASPAPAPAAAAAPAPQPNPVADPLAQSDKEYDAAAEDARQRRIAVGIGQALSQGIGAATGAKADPNFYAQLNEAANQPLANIKAKKAGQKDQLEFQQALRNSKNAVDGEDPNSELNKKFYKSIAPIAKSIGIDPKSVTYADYQRNKDIYEALYKAKEQEKLKQMEIDGELKKEAMKGNNSQNSPNGDQTKAALFATRMQQAEQVFQGLEKEGYNRADYSDAASRKLKPEGFFNEKQKQQDQGERNFLNAVLRRESGAAIAPSEFEQGALQYFPRVGDSARVKDQKRQNRQLAINALKAEAGPTAIGRIELPKSNLVKKQYSKSRNQTRLVYSDGSTEIKDGQV